MTKINEELISILLSEPEPSEIRILLNAEVLNKDEAKLCDELFRNYSLIGKSQIEYMLRQLGYDNDYLKSIKIYQKEELIDKLDEYIQMIRISQNETICKLALDKSTYDEYNKQSIDLLNRRYNSSIIIKKDNILEELEDYSSFENRSKDEIISFEIDYLDEVSSDIPKSKVTTIISNDIKNKSTYAINLAYKMITKGRNVLFISLNMSKKLAYLNIISRHSCDEKFKNKLSIKELTTSFDEELFGFVYEDLFDSLKEHLFIYDSSNYNIENTFTFQRLISAAENYFTQINGKKIDAIILDGLEKLHIDTSRRIITSRNHVETEYYSYFNDIAESKQIPIIITNESLPSYNDLLNNGIYYNLSYISDTSIKYSSAILTIRSSSAMDKKKQLEISLLKHPSGNLVEALLVCADKNYSIIHFMVDSLEETESNKIFVERLKTEIDSLNKEKEELNQKAEHSNELLMDVLSSKNKVSDDLDTSIFDFITLPD